MDNTAQVGGRIGDPDSDQETREAKAGRVHLIDIERLIIHKYPEPAALLRKADKISRDIIHSELREGETLRVAKPGRYHLLLPKLLPAAGALRTSVITEQLFRAISDLNPAKKYFDDQSGAKQEKPATPIARATAPIKRCAAPPPIVKSDRNRYGGRSEDEMARAANNAVAMMSNDIRTKTEELFTSPQAKALLADIATKFQPIWNTKRLVVSGYRVVLTGCVDAFTTSELTMKYDLGSNDATNALLDAMRYKFGNAALEQLANVGEQAVIIVPMAFSTADCSRYIGAFLNAGAQQIQDSDPKHVVFELTDVPAATSRYRLREAAAYLRSRSRTLSVCLGADWNMADLSRYREFGVYGVGIDLSKLALGEGRVMKIFETFAEKCEAAGVVPFCNAVNKFSLVTSAVVSGIMYVSGQAVVPNLNVPHGVAHLDLPRLLSMTKRSWGHAWH